MNLKIKICGMQQSENIKDVATFQPDYMGFIFYPKSPRFAGGLDPEVVAAIPTSICKVGVFVNENIENILATAFKYQLNAIQLHGNESPETCAKLRDTKLIVIKALSIASETDLEAASKYQENVDLLLFDTKTPLYGGSGQQYDWTILEKYHGYVPFFLSGGIGSNDTTRILHFHHPLLYGVDINSRFETRTGEKNIAALTAFMNDLNH